MYDDYDLDYTFMQDRTYDLDEMYDAYVHASSTHTHLDDNMYTYDLDDEYERDSHDYETLAYQHYAWYNNILVLSEVGSMLAQKRSVTITLEVECYDDLHFEDLDWNDILELEGDENVEVQIRELADIY